MKTAIDASWAFAISDATHKQFCLSRGKFNSESHRLRKSKAIILPIA
jgi:hypothetical protein